MVILVISLKSNTIAGKGRKIKQMLWTKDAIQKHAPSWFKEKEIYEKSQPITLKLLAL